ncbi:MAG: hypothetical protein ACRDXX_03880 [Stackebrandtia sp.]
MALNNATLNIPGIGYVYLAPPGTPRPDHATDARSPWVDLGHSSEDGLTITFEVEKTVKKTWRNRIGVRETVDDVTFNFAWTALQFDYPSLMAYFSGGDTSVAGVFGVTRDVTPYERAVYIRLVDGASEIDVYIARAGLGPAGEIEAGPEEFAGMPIAATVLDDESAAHLVDFLSPHLGSPDGPVATKPLAATPAKASA